MYVQLFFSLLCVVKCKMKCLVWRKNLALLSATSLQPHYQPLFCSTSPITSPYFVLPAQLPALILFYQPIRAGRESHRAGRKNFPRYARNLHQKKTTSPITSPVKALPAHRAGREGHRAGRKKFRASRGIFFIKMWSYQPIKSSKGW